MELILVRHGKAQPHGHPAGDAERALVAKGWKQARAVGALLKAADFLPRLVLTSPMVRARETAEGMCEAAGIPGPVVQAWLACGMEPEAAAHELTAFGEFPRVALVGHEPDFSQFAAWLLGTSAVAVEMKKGAVAAFQVDAACRRGRLLFLVPPSLGGAR